MKAFGALEMGLKEDELKPLVNAWRRANPNVVRFWWAADNAAKTAVKQKKITETHGIRFSYQSNMLFVTLPSGRKLAYVKPRIGENRFGSECVTYEGIGATKKWDRIESSPGKWVENITQAVASITHCPHFAPPVLSCMFTTRSSWKSTNRYYPLLSANR